MQASSNSPERNGNLDCLRALAIMLVVLFHTEGYLQFPAVFHVMRGWWSGVDLFFVLSGFLIGGIAIRQIQRHDHLPVLHFLARRWWRTLPPYVAALITIYVLSAVILKEGHPFYWQYAVFIQNYTFAGQLPYFGVSWSLCVEEQFYLFLPLFLLWVDRRRLGLAVSLLAVGCVLAPLISRLCVFGTPLQVSWEYATHHYCGGLGVGVWLAWRHAISDPPSDRQRRITAIGAGVAFLFMLFYAIIPFTKWGEYVIGRMSLIFACGMLVHAAVTTGPWLRPLSRVIRSMAIWSYSIYLIHVPVIVGTLMVTASWGTPVQAIIAIAASIGAGWIFWFLTERPAFWLREKFSPRGRDEKPMV